MMVHRNPLHISICLLSIMLLKTQVAHAATWYVSTTGSTALGHGLSATDPTALYRAVQQATTGDNIWVAAGTYVDQGILNIDYDFTITAASGLGSVTIDCTYRGVPVNPCVSVLSPVNNRAIITNLVFTNYKTAIEVDGGAPRILNNRFSNTAGSVDPAIEIINGIGTTDTVQIEQNSFEDNIYGISWESPSGGLISDNEFLDGNMDLALLDGSPTVQDNTFRRGRAGVQLNTTSTQTLFRNHFYEKTEWAMNIPVGAHQITSNTFEKNVVAVNIDTGTTTSPQTSSPTLKDNVFQDDVVSVRLNATSGNTVSAVISKNFFYTATDSAVLVDAANGTQTSKIDANQMLNNRVATTITAGTPSITNNYLDFNQDGVQIDSSSYIPHAIVAYNTIKNGGNGIVVTGENADESGIFNNIVVYHNGYGIKVDALGTRTGVGSNDSYLNASGNYVGTYTDWGRNASFDPIFVGIWILDPSSPANGYANTSLAFEDHDLNSTSRSSTGTNRPEIGCYEIPTHSDGFVKKGDGAFLPGSGPLTK